jgi:Tol biopolymer transport system component
LKTNKEMMVPDSKDRISATISPDGRYIAATTDDGQKLLIFDFAAQKWSELGNVSVSSMQWSADSKVVYFDAGSSAEPAIYRFHIADRKFEVVASLKSLRRVIPGTGAWMGLTPDGSPLLMRDTATQEVYALDFEEP